MIVWRLLIVVAVLLLVVQQARGEGGRPVRVLSVVGLAAADDSRLSAGETLDPSRPVRLVARPGAVVQALIGERLALALVGRKEVTVRGGLEQVELGRGNGGVRLAGSAGTVLVEGWRFRLDPDGGSLLVDGDRVYLQAGKAWWSAPGGAPTTIAGTLRPGQMVEVKRGAPPGAITVVEAAPAPYLTGRMTVYQPPDPWEPLVHRPDVEQVRRAQTLRRQQQTKEREMASCGCTEGSGPAEATQISGGESSNPIEARNTTVRVRVRGLPKKVAQ